jgi:uncharacterized protein YbjQ (UPF0145 family)
MRACRGAAENERIRNARDLHDLLGHSLTTVSVMAGLACESGPQHAWTDSATRERRLTVGNPGRGLPPVAQARLAEIGSSGTWGSALTADEFAAIKSTGFEPVGQVLGAAVYNIGYTGGYACPGLAGGYGLGGFGLGRYASYSGPLGTATALSSDGSMSSYAPMVQTLYQARRAAIGRMTAECEALGGHGVVGVALTIGAFPAGGLEFKAIGTAVRAPGGVPLKRRFTSDLSGQDFAKLILAGWVPVGLVLGISIGARHDDWVTVTQARWGAGNTEVQGYTDLVTATRHDARGQLEREVISHGADGVVLQRMDIRVREHACAMQEGRRDHVVEATIIGTAIAKFGRRRAGPAAPLAIMSLDPQRRQAARVRLGP